jgi:hypothetical protein
MLPREINYLLDVLEAARLLYQNDLPPLIAQLEQVVPTEE